MLKRILVEVQGVKLEPSEMFKIFVIDGMR